MAPLFDEETTEELRKIFSSFKRPLKDILIIDSVGDPDTTGKCRTCSEAKLLAEELQRVSDGKLQFEILDSSRGKIYRPRYLPAFIYDTKKRNIRYYGIPSGQEFAPFIHIHMHILEGIHLPSNIVEELESIEIPLHIKVFVTPECPYCPLVVDFLNQVGLVNDNFIVETIEAFEHPFEADKYMVHYVPYVAINRIEDYDHYGARPIEVLPGYAPEEEIVAAIKRAVRKLKSK